jgi:hypothetical protein
MGTKQKLNNLKKKKHSPKISSPTHEEDKLIVWVEVYESLYQCPIDPIISLWANMTMQYRYYDISNRIKPSLF